MLEVTDATTPWSLSRLAGSTDGTEVYRAEDIKLPAGDRIRDKDTHRLVNSHTRCCLDGIRSRRLRG